MRYEPPKGMPYENGLTAKLMYDIVDGLLRQHITEEDVSRFERDIGLGLGKLWTKREIRTELEEFVESYFLGDLRAPLPDFQDIFKRGTGLTAKLDDYVGRLEQHYGSREQANNTVKSLLQELHRRYERLRIENHNAESLEGGETLIKKNTTDSFGTISTPYTTRIQLAMIHMGLQI